MKCVFSLDDFCWQYWECIPYLEELNNYFDNFKVSLFTIPCYAGISLSQYWKELNNVNFKYEHILHGYYHSPLEFDYLSKQQAKDYIQAGIVEFARCNIPVIKGFKCPNWKYSEGTVEALKELGFWLATYRPVQIDGVRTYNWNWDIGELLPGVEVLHAHGHTHKVSGPGKGVNESMENIKQLDRDTEFLFISEVMR
jgi:hypothetical protein